MGKKRHPTPSIMKSNRRSFRLCGYCGYYPASEHGGACCFHCVRDHLDYLARQQEEEARDIAKREADRVRAEQRKREFDQMVVNSARKPGISFADVLKK